MPFLAAFEDREADVLVYAGVSYVVEESQDWPRYTRAIALRETWMRWPWQRRERRDSGGDFSDAVVRLIEAQAAGTVADVSSTVAVEAASGALSRAFASPGVVRGRLGARMPFSGRPGANGARSNPVGRLDARDAHGRRRNGAVDSGFVPALRRLARSGDVDRARNSVNAGVNSGHGAGVKRGHLLMPDTVLPVVPGVHWRDPRCFV